jgi:secreted trypsin-like serine protease
MEFRSRGLVFASLLGATACTGPTSDDSPVASQSQAIVAGDADTGDPAVVEFIALLPNDMAGTCTATLISPHVLLTAAHCVVETSGARYGVYLGNDDRGLNSKTFIPLASVAYDPQYDNNHPDDGHDFGVGILTTALNTTPVPVNHVALGSDKVGATARYVGYGLSDGVKMTGSGLKRQASEPIAQITDRLIRIATNPNNTCEGDSGGPLLLNVNGAESIAGVVSFGDDEHCLQNSYFQRVDSQVAWIDQQIQTYDPTSAAMMGTGGSSGSGGATGSGASTGGNPGSSSGGSTGSTSGTGGDQGAITRPIPTTDPAAQVQVPTHASGGGCSYGTTTHGASALSLLLGLTALARPLRRRSPPQ